MLLEGGMSISRGTKDLGHQPTPTRFNNRYYTFLLNSDWTKRNWNDPFQYEDGSKQFMMLPTDFVLLKDFFFKEVHSCLCFVHSHLY